eukprot:scaffold99026_cov58-Phaeocystis_antarctica.AAC.2
MPPAAPAAAAIAAAEGKYSLTRHPPPHTASATRRSRGMRKIAAHLGYEPTTEQWPKILEYTSFAWMKEHQEKFEVTTLMPFPLILPGGMVRKG